jgi:hypothetical protein
MAKEMKIMIGDDDYLNIDLISSNEFSSLKKELIQIDENLINKKGISRIWRSQNQNIFLEFYNGVAIKINSKNELEKLEKVEFLRLLYTKKENEISYLTSIDEDTFHSILKKSVPANTPEAFSFFGKYYQINNTNFILIEWSKGFQKGKYSILESQRTMIGIDLELRHFLKDDEVVNERQIVKNKIEETPIEVKEGIHTNAIVYKELLANRLNLDLKIFNYSIQSLNTIEQSLFWNADNLNHYDIVLPFTSYIGEILVKEKSMKWQIPEKYEYPILISEEDEKLDLLWRLQEGLVGTDYGLPEITWVFKTIMKELK